MRIPRTTVRYDYRTSRERASKTLNAEGSCVCERERESSVCERIRIANRIREKRREMTTICAFCFLTEDWLMCHPLTTPIFNTNHFNANGLTMSPTKHTLVHVCPYLLMLINIILNKV